MMCPTNLSSCCPLACPLRSNSRIPNRSLHNRFFPGRSLPSFPISQPSTFDSPSSNSISWTVRPASRRAPTAFQNCCSTSCLSVPNMCRLSTYCTCHSSWSWVALPSRSLEEGSNPAASQMRSLTRWQKNKAHFHPMGMTLTRGYTQSCGFSFTPSTSSKPKSAARQRLKPK